MVVGEGVSPFLFFLSGMKERRSHFPAIKVEISLLSLGFPFIFFSLL